MTKVRSIRKVVEDWFAERPEYKDRKPPSLDKLIAGTVTLDEAIASVRASVRFAIGAVSRAEGKNAVRDATGEVVYLDPMELTPFAFIHDYFVPQIKRIDADTGRLRSRVREYAAANPELGMSYEQLWEQGMEAVRDAAAV